MTVSNRSERAAQNPEKVDAQREFKLVLDTLSRLRDWASQSFGSDDHSTQAIEDIWWDIHRLTERLEIMVPDQLPTGESDSLRKTQPKRVSKKDAPVKGK